MRVFLDAPAGVEGHDHGTRPTGGQVALDVAVLVEHQNCDAIAVAEATGAQRPGKARHAISDLAPRAPAALEDGGDGGRFDLQGTPQSVGDVHGEVLILNVLYVSRENGAPALQKNFRDGAIALRS